MAQIDCDGDEHADSVEDFYFENVCPEVNDSEDEDPNVLDIELDLASPISSRSNITVNYRDCSPFSGECNLLTPFGNVCTVYNGLNGGNGLNGVNQHYQNPVNQQSYHYQQIQQMHAEGQYAMQMQMGWGHAVNGHNNGYNQCGDHSGHYNQSMVPTECPPDFHSMNIHKLLEMQLTLCEIFDFHLLGRYIHDKRGNQYLLHILDSVSFDERVTAIRDLLEGLLKIQMDWIKVSDHSVGHHLILRLFEYGTSEQHTMLMEHFVYRSVLVLSQLKFGCRVVQGILDMVDEENRKRFVQCFEEQWKGMKSGERMSSFLCVNTSHVLMKMIRSNLPVQSVAFIASALEEDLVRVSEDANACRVVQAFIQCYGDKLNVMKLCERGEHIRLAMTQYGNYVIQCIIKRKEWYSDSPRIIAFRNQLIGDVFTMRSLMDLGLQKSGSHVIEACIRVANPHHLDTIIAVVKRKRAWLLNKLIFDQFGNYVIKTLLNHCSHSQREEVVHVVDRHLVRLNDYDRGQNYRYGTEVINQCKAIKRSMDAKQRKGRRNRKINVRW